MQAFKLLLSITIPFLTFTSQADTARIASSIQNLGQVAKIFLAPGLISQIEFPEPILEVKVGAPEKFQFAISTTNAAILNLYVSDSKPFSTNLIVNTSRRTFVFDLMPSLSKHQDYLRINGAVGGPSRQGRQKVIAEGVIGPASYSSNRKTIWRGRIQ